MEAYLILKVLWWVLLGVLLIGLGHYGRHGHGRRHTAALRRAN